MRTLATAAAWRVRLTEAGLESSAAFEAWLAEDEANEAAWRQVAAPWELLTEHATDPEVMAARRHALAQLAPPARQTHRDSRRNYGWSAAAAVAAIAVVVGWFLLVDRPLEYRTARGERRVLPLEDGSKVSLDSNTVVQLHYSADARQVQLLEGQARFDVAHEAHRPFSVVAGDRKVVATGTSFNIDLRDAQVVVTLMEGRVLVTSATGHGPATEYSTVQPIALVAGQALTASIDAPNPPPPTIETVSIEAVTSWQSGRLIFDNETLRSAVERVGRYADQRIVIADEQAAQLRFSGIFNSGDVTTFLDAVSRYLPVKATTRPDGSVLLSSTEHEN